MTDMLAYARAVKNPIISSLPGSYNVPFLEFDVKQKKAGLRDQFRGTKSLTKRLGNNLEIILNIHEIFGRGENESCQLDVSSMPDKGEFNNLYSIR